MLLFEKQDTSSRTLAHGHLFREVVKPLIIALFLDPVQTFRTYAYYAAPCRPPDPAFTNDETKSRVAPLHDCT
ncbi:unnamed protein product [Zymoseptoria tritici ST99CH_1A5]|nr:unnamed protein product [Zymoseptoria tritici ST99CH_3D1]SMY30334.1 unnamed protein product [Zymoseptoria tritici ST99CH_1A5]